MPSHWPLLLALFPLVLPAQAIPEGTRVRVHDPCAPSFCEPLIGRLQWMTDDSLAVKLPGGEVERIGRGSALRVDVSHGMRSRVWEGLGVGLLAGVAAGFVWQRICAGPGDGPDDSECGLAYLVTVPPGILLGGIVGAHLHTEWWLPAPGARLTVVPLRRGVGIGVSAALP